MNNESGVDATGMSINRRLALSKKDCYEETKCSFISSLF